MKNKDIPGQCSIFDFMPKSQNLVRTTCLFNEEWPCNIEGAHDVARKCIDIDCQYGCCRSCKQRDICGARCWQSKEKIKKVKAGEWVESDVLGEKLTFEEITKLVGQLIVMDMSTVSHKWYKVVMVEKIVPYENARRLVYYDGEKQRGMVNEMYFEDDYPGWKSNAYRLRKNVVPA